MNLISKLFGKKEVEYSDKSYHWISRYSNGKIPEMKFTDYDFFAGIDSCMKIVIKNKVEFPRYKFTVNTPDRKLQFQIVVGDPLTLVTIGAHGDEYYYDGYSVRKHGDGFSAEVGISKALEHAIDGFREKGNFLSFDEKVILSKKISHVIQEVKKWNS